MNGLNSFIDFSWTSLCSANATLLIYVIKFLNLMTKEIKMTYLHYIPGVSDKWSVVSVVLSPTLLSTENKTDNKIVFLLSF